MQTKNATLEQLLINAGVVNFIGDSHNYTAPLGIHLQNLFSEKRVMEAVTIKMAPEILRTITHIVGFGYDGIMMGRKVSDYLHKEFFPLEYSDYGGGLKGFESKMPLRGYKIGLVTGILKTGITTSEKLNLIRGAGGECQNIYPIVDLGFKLKINSLKRDDVKINPCVTLKSIATKTENQKLLTWIEQNESLLR